METRTRVHSKCEHIFVFLKIFPYIIMSTIFLIPLNMAYPTPSIGYRIADKNEEECE